MKLYVKSISTGAIERSPGFLFHSCDLRGTQNITFFPKEDQRAIEFLKEKGVKFELIDLSKCSLRMKLKAKINGVNKTPTLVLDDGTILKGKQQIIDYFNRQIYG